MGRREIIGGILLMVASKAGASAAQEVNVLNEDGKTLYRSHYEWLSQRRVVVPASVYEKLGFEVTRDFRKGTLQIRTPRAKTGFTFSVNQQEVQEPRGMIGSTDTVRYERPALKIIKGEFYVAPMALKNYFPGLATTTWNSADHTVVLQRTHELNRRLGMMR